MVGVLAHDSFKLLSSDQVAEVTSRPLSGWMGRRAGAERERVIEGSRVVSSVVNSGYVVLLGFPSLFAVRKAARTLV